MKQELVKTLIDTKDAAGNMIDDLNIQRTLLNDVFDHFTTLKSNPDFNQKQHYNHDRMRVFVDLIVDKALEISIAAERINNNVDQVIQMTREDVA